jgi:acyl-CoA thioesterase FadM
MNGRKQVLTVTGIVLSPEYIYTIGPGDMVPDPRRFGVFYMSRKALEGIFDMGDAFNNVVLSTLRGTNLDVITAAIDDLLEQYGGRGAYGREDQISDTFLANELDELRAMAAVIPPIFLFVAAFLVNMILTRLITLEREQIGLLKANEFPSPFFIVAEATCQYKAPIDMDTSLIVQVRVSRLGNSSFDMEYRFVDESSGAVLAAGRTVQVTFDYTAGRSVPLPDEWRAAMTQFEGL